MKKPPTLAGGCVSRSAIFAKKLALLAGLILSRLVLTRLLILLVRLLGLLAALPALTTLLPALLSALVLLTWILVRHFTLSCGAPRS